MPDARTDETRARIGAKLKAKRSALKMSQQDLADASGVQRHEISRIEAGKRNFTVDTIVALCAALGIKTISVDASKNKS